MKTSVKPLPSRLSRHPAMPRYQLGLSLVELMISLTIGLFLLLGITTLIVQQNSAHSEMEKASSQIENGRYAMQILHDDIQHAGFYGLYSPPKTGTVYTIPDECVANNSGWDGVPLGAPNVPVAIFGYSSAGRTADPTSCAALSNYKANTAILVVRRTTTASVASAVAGTTYLQSSQCTTDAIPFVAGVAGVFTLKDKLCATPSPLYQYLVNIYYISTCDVCSPSDGIPTLKRVQNGAAAEPLVEGIENMQFEYGLDTAPVPGDGSPDSYTTTPAATDWANVMTVRINLLARNNSITTGYQDTKTYNLGGASSVGPYNDKYKRHAFTSLVRAINLSGRRE